MPCPFAAIAGMTADSIDGLRRLCGRPDAIPAIIMVKGHKQAGWYLSSPPLSAWPGAATRFRLTKQR